MTLENDMIRLVFANGATVNVDLHANPQCGITWPPPERLVFWGGATFVRVSMSMLTDEQASGSKHLARGAEYQEELEAVNVLPI